MILATFGIIPIVKGVLLGAILLLILRSLSIEEAYDSINWSVIFLIAALFPIGIAIHKTGADIQIGELIIKLGISLGGIEDKKHSKYFIKNYCSRVPLNRMGNISDLYGALIYFSGENSNYTVGQNLIIDGGLTVW